MDTSDRHLPPHCRNHPRGSCVDWLHSCRRRGCGCLLMARWFHCCGCSNFNRHMFGRKKLVWFAQGGDSLRGARMAAIHGYRSPDCHARLQQLSQAKDFYDQTRCSCLIGATGSPLTSEPADTPRDEWKSCHRLSKKVFCNGLCLSCVFSNDYRAGKGARR